MGLVVIALIIGTPIHGLPVSAVESQAGILDPNMIRNNFNEWKLKYSKSYATHEEDKRFGVFMRNLKMILEHNIKHTMGETSFIMELNGDADLSFEEWKSTKLSFRASTDATLKAGMHVAPLIRGVSPDFVDWRAKGAVTPVKDQGVCLSCWAFSATGAIEGAHFLATGHLVSLSEEQLINCVDSGSFDCSTGGDIPTAFEYVINNKGVTSEDSEPYTSSDRKPCKYKPYSGSGTNPYAATISSYKLVASNDEEALKSAVAQQPVSIAFQCTESIRFYSSGVFDDPLCCHDCQLSDLNHGGLVVGYGTEDGKDYWLIKNSASADWGDKGFIKIIKNGTGACGVPTYAVYPVV
jgi:C1A family cysteine protease